MEKNECIFFCYGTLKEGFNNHRCLGKEREYLGEFRTESNYTLFDGGFPVVERGGETAIEGELYKVTNEHDISRVFSLEGCSQVAGAHNSFYDFEEIDTPKGKAIIFVMNKGKSDRSKKLESGIWK